MNTVKVDLHVHSHFSDSPKIYLLAKADSRECYTTPEQVYQRAMARGMDLVTITDHDTIQGALEIAHHGPHVFISEEVSARFPDNGCVVHVLVYGITEAQHDEIQRLRYNIYDLVPYLRQQGIVHALAHPLSSVNQRLKREHLEQCFLMFKNIELLNGPRDPYHRKALEDIFGAMTRKDLERWANEYNLEPIDWDPARGFVGGSDDHSGIAIARAYTSFEGPATVQGLFDAIDERRTRPEGEFMTPVSAAHNIYSGVVQYYLDKKETQSQDGIYHQLYEGISTGGASLMARGDLRELMRSPLGRLIGAFQAVGLDTSVLSWERMLQEGDKEGLHREINTMAMKLTRHAFSGLSQELVDAVSRIDLDAITQLIPAALQMLLLHVPYYIGYRYFYQDRRRAEALHKAIGLGYEASKEQPSVAIFCDTLDDVNGVTLGLRRMVRELHEQGKNVYLLGVRTPTVGSSAGSLDQWADEAGVGAVVRFEPLATFAPPGYDHMPLGLPPVLEMMQWCVEHEIDLIQLSTPGPVGWAGLAIAKMLASPVVGHYHTQVPEYTERLIGDKNITGIVRAFVGWFYGAMDRVIVPSRATFDNLLDMGLRRERLSILSRGVDTQRFSPQRRDPSIWQRYGLNGVKKLLYVGRVSREKNLDALLETYQGLRDNGVAVELAIVGDGPYREELRQRMDGDQGVSFTGYVGGDDLAALFASADLFVFPSSTDTFGNVILEAQASSLPVVVTDQGGPAELIVPERTGVMVPADNQQALQQAVHRLLSDDALRQRMSSAAPQHVQAMSHNAAARELWDFYNHQIAQDQDVRTEAVRQGV